MGLAHIHRTHTHKHRIHTHTQSSHMCTNTHAHTQTLHTRARWCKRFKTRAAQDTAYTHAMHTCYGVRIMPKPHTHENVFYSRTTIHKYKTSFTNLCILLQKQIHNVLHIQRNIFLQLQKNILQVQTKIFQVQKSHVTNKCPVIHTTQQQVALLSQFKAARTIFFLPKIFGCVRNDLLIATYYLLNTWLTSRILK